MLLLVPPPDLTMITVTKLAPALGAEIGNVDASGPLEDATIAAIRAAWLEHHVLRIRGQSMTDPQLLEFSKRFGELVGLDQTINHKLAHEFKHRIPLGGRIKLNE